MRSDMAKVIVERPRLGSRARGPGKGYRRQLQRLGHDAPKRERIKQRPSKHFNEHLGPLRRYLAKQVGRPWNLVNSELYRHIGRDSVVTNHVFTHIEQYVAIRVIEIDGVLCRADGYGVGRPLDGYPPFYVCPRSGLLKLNRSTSRRERCQRHLAMKVLHVSVDFDTVFVRKDGVWMRVRVGAFPKFRRDAAGLAIPVHDALCRGTIGPADAIHLYGRCVVGLEARHATREEIRKHCEPLKAPNRVS